MRTRIEQSIVYLATSDAGTQRTSLDSLLASVVRPGAHGQHDGELLPDLAVARIQDHVPGVLVNSRDASDRTLDPGLLKGLADCRLGERLAEVDRAAGERPVAVVGAADHQDLARIVNGGKTRDQGHLRERHRGKEGHARAGEN